MLYGDLELPPDRARAYGRWYMTLAWLIFVGGLLHFSLLSTGATAAKVLDWPVSLARLDPLNRQLI